MKICSVCIMDETTKEISFDLNGKCSYCYKHEALEKSFPQDNSHLKIIDKIIKDGTNKKYDCVVGLSGGRDSSYTVHLMKKYGLRALVVHFNDGFGNPLAGENIKKIIDKTNFELRSITSDWRESKEIKISCLKASVPDIEIGTDLGIAASLYSTACKENIKYIITGTSFRTEGIAPLDWNYLDGKYLKSIQNKFGNIKIRKWHPNDAGFNLDLKEMIYYTFYKRIQMVPILYYEDYVRKNAEQILVDEYDWKNPGAHYFDDLYQSLIFYVLRTKFNIDFRKFNYSALIRSGQMERKEAMDRTKEIYSIEDKKIIDLCIKRLGLSMEEFNKILKKEKKSFRDYKTNYKFVKASKIVVYILSKLNILHPSTYYKFF